MIKLKQLISEQTAVTPTVKFSDLYNTEQTQNLSGDDNNVTFEVESKGYLVETMLVITLPTETKNKIYPDNKPSERGFWTLKSYSDVLKRDRNYQGRIGAALSNGGIIIPLSKNQLKPGANTFTLQNKSKQVVLTITINIEV